MKPVYALALALVSHVAAAEPQFYVLDVRHTGDAVLHSSSQSVSAKAGLPYVLVDTPAVNCCFHVGVKPGQRTSSVRINEDAPPLTSEDGDEIYQVAGYVADAPRSSRPAADNLAFGLRGMTLVRVKEKQTYEVGFAKGTKPVIVKHCLGAEGVNFRLYHASTDRAPYASYYFALGYDTAPNCE